MKDFIKWLGVNEKIAKVVVWLMIIMVMLIITNTMLESVGFPHYAITYENLVKIKFNLVAEYLVNWLLIILDFYAIVLLVFRIKDIKKIFKYAMLYLMLNVVLSLIVPHAIMQVFIILYVIMFCYFYSNKNKKYILYSILSVIAVILIQGVWYLSKARFIDYSTLNDVTKSILLLDYFIIIGIIILVKEIYLKKRGESNARERNKFLLGRRLQKRKQIRKETSKESSKRS